MEETNVNSPIKQNSRVLRRLRCSVQNYDWGRVGYESRVAKMFSLNSGSDIEPEKPYAEFWMGAHDSLPSYVIDVDSCVANGDSETASTSLSLKSSCVGNGDSESASTSLSLKSWILKNPEVLGDKVVERWDCSLPFLFKVLSIAKALSIQAHPDKEWAHALHKSQPNIYKDGNHKPEMAIAINEFEALCGFISLQELKSLLNNVPEIVELVSSTDVDQLLHISELDAKEAKPILQSIFTHIMLASKDTISMSVIKIKTRLQMESQLRQLTEKEQLVLLLDKQYPGDAGVLAALFFNYIKLKPSEALYLGANEPHAYLGGECIECMATSDNVVRAGLTPKHKDIQTLCSMLSYKQGFPEILQGVPLNPYTRRYRPPFDEFEVDSCILPPRASTVFPSVPGPSIFIITYRKGTMQIETFEDLISEGDVLFAPANTEICITSVSELVLYRAGVNGSFF